MSGIVKEYVGGIGTVRSSGYKGKVGTKGLRNKRKAYWSKVHNSERLEKERKAKRRERERDSFGGDPFAWENEGRN